ncbi:DUF2339 domain-containing protein [Xanthomonas sp. XNM01]|uniref:DUF2339 domain-containing protein n=1 Tax=Xanthomonas sp. XNM01 TaxID=2769289 RepID=UPI00177C631C|nr:DUF2339 domain-containing protein [Xanthomonas sp. XNM01]MBD9369392.1 DUF2339 domain-containing protein [Xanthomonas sp. XNM01]
MELMLVLLGLAVLAMPILLVFALVSVAGLKRRVAALELRLETSEPASARARPGASAPQASAVDAPPVPDTVAPAMPDAPRDTAADSWLPPPVLVGVVPPPLPSAAAEPPAGTPSPERPAAADAAATATVRGPAVTGAPRGPAPPSPLEAVLRAVKRWFTVGNIPVKIGMLVLLAGVAALLKHASDQGLLSIPMPLRLAGIAAVAMGGLVFGWIRRERQRAFALSLQGGMIGVLLLTVFAAFKLYGLIPAGAAFALSIVLVAGVGLLAVLQDARALAVLALLAGFLAPIWLSTGSGNHVALFSYYAVLNVAIVGIAWFKSWRILNLLGFAFTFGIGTLWGALSYRPEHFGSTQPFLLLFFLLYLAVPLLFARRQPASRRDLVDGCLVFGTPLVAFSLQAGLMWGDRLPLAFCALGVAALYALLARVCLGRGPLRVLGESYAVLAVGFATLAVPLALSAHATASVFALEGAALVWLGLRQRRWLPQLGGTALQLAAALACLAGVDADVGDALPLLDATFLSALLIALAGFASAWAARAHGASAIALVWYLWGLGWWCGNGAQEIAGVVDTRAVPHALLAFAAVTLWLAAEVHRRRMAMALVVTVLGGVLAAFPLALLQAIALAHPLAGDGLWAWPLFALLGARALYCVAGMRPDSAILFAWWLLWPLVLSWSAAWWGGTLALGAGWQALLAALPWLGLALVSLLRWRWLAWPLGTGFDAWRAAWQTTCFAILAAGWMLALTQPAGAAPLPWLPLLNPLELAQLAALLLAARWLWSPAAPAPLRHWRLALVAAAGFVLVTVSTLRGVHHWGGLAWAPELLSGSLAQTALTVLWSALGVVGWVVGSRRARRGLWLAGAVLMGVVLAKLVLVDRQHLGNLLGIASFIVYGLLCTVIGYLAPAPSRQAPADRSDSEERIA